MRANIHSLHNKIYTCFTLKEKRYNCFTGDPKSMYSHLTNCGFYRYITLRNFLGIQGMNKVQYGVWQSNEVPGQIGGCFNSREQRGVNFQTNP